MKPTSIFRLLIILSLILPFAGMAYSNLMFESFSAETQDILSWDGHGGVFDTGTEEVSNKELVVVGLAVVLAIAMVIGYLGLFLFKRWGRLTVVIISIIAFLFMPFIGISITPATELLLDDISNIMFGSVIAMSYLPPLSDKFHAT